MTRNRRRMNKSDDTSLAGQLMGLSLFIMLLAFFIVLNAISTFSEQKFRPALASLEGTFGSKLEGVDNRPSVAPSDQKSIYEGDTLEQMRALFNAHIAGLEVNVEDHFGTMHVRLPLADLMEAVREIDKSGIDKADVLDAQDQFFLPTLVSLMQTEEQPKKYRMDIILNLPGDPAELKNDNPGALKEPLSQLSALAGKLESVGLKMSFLSVGLARGEENMADLYFRPFERFSVMEDADNFGASIVPDQPSGAPREIESGENEKGPPEESGAAPANGGPAP